MLENISPKFLSIFFTETLKFLCTGIGGCYIYYYCYYWHSGCLIAPFFGRLNPDQIYSALSSSSRPSSPGAGVSSLDPKGGSDGPQEDGATAVRI
jgi:hypothetical protein